MISKTKQLPTGTRIGLIVCAGNLPQEVAKRAKANGISIHAINMIGYADTNSALSSGDWHSIGHIGKIIKTLKREQCDGVCFAGQINRPDFKKLKLDAKGVKELAKVLLAARKGDDALLRAIASIFEKEGLHVISPQQLASDLLAPSGAINQVLPTKQNHLDMEQAKAAVHAIGSLDIGQAAVVCNGLVLAVEAQEGTSAMLRRCASLPKQIRGNSEQRAGVLVKFPKPKQDQRTDLPTIGMETVSLAAAAGLAGIAIAAGASFLVDRQQICELADEQKMFLWGMDVCGGPDQV